MPIDQQNLARTLERLGTVHPVPSLPDALQTVTEASRQLFGVGGSGLMFVDESNVLAYVAASDDAARALEQEQEALGGGPCVDALVHGTVVQTRDIADDPRWPELARAVVPHGVRAVLGVPVRLAGIAVGSFDAYASEPRVWDDSDVAAVGAFSELVAALVRTAIEGQRHEVLATQLQYALDHRVELERAVGVIMARDRVGPVDAFNQLRDAARAERVKVGVVARRILDGLEGGA